MTPIELLKLMGEMGTMYSENNLEEINDYCTLMLLDDRVIMISEDSKPIAFIFYSITDDPEKYLKKGTYEYLSHDKHGKTVYIEKLVSFHWNKYLRILFERLITSKYPQLEHGIWYRATKWGDRKVVTRRRLECTK